jgi:aminoglycoside phosphotransferase (APT) family kinase protein
MPSFESIDPRLRRRSPVAMSDVDLQALGGWMAGATPQLGRPLALEKFASGQSNPTYRLDTEGGPVVLRRKPFGHLLPSAHAVEREHRLIAALHPAGFPVPRPLALCEDAKVIGAPFYLMSLVDGRHLVDGALPGLSPAERQAHYEAMIDTLAALHAIHPEAIGLADFGRPGNYFLRQVERWTKQYRAAQTDDLPAMERLIAWLPQAAPEQDRACVIHGDYRIDNLLFAKDGPRVDAVIDWELATLGDPLADFTYLAMQWILPADGGAGLAGLDLAALGIPSLETAVARYCAATGRAEPPDLHWFFAYNLFRLAGIVQGVKKRMLDGNASNPKAAATVAKLGLLAEAAWNEARLAGATEGR